MSHFREDLRTRRKLAGLTQQALAEKAGIDHSYVSKMETEEYYPTRDVALSLAAAFGISGQDKFDFLLEARVASKEDVEEFEQVDVEGDELEGEQAVPTNLPSLIHPAVALSNLVLEAAFEQIETVFESKHFSKEQMKQAATELVASANQIARLIKP